MTDAASQSQSADFSSADLELARMTIELLDTLRVPEELNKEYGGIYNLETKIDEYGRLYQRLYSVLFLEEEDEVSAESAEG